MKTWFWIILVAFLLLAGYVVVDLVRHQRMQARPQKVASEVSAESVTVYMNRVADLRARADSLKQRIKAVGTAERREVKARIAEFERVIAELQRAIDAWRVARDGDAPDAAYRQCILLYGQGRGVCEALAPDTLTGR
jgi:hypothetical protein